MIKVDGDEIPITGYYSYLCHVDERHPECFVPMQSNRMLFKKGETAPKLGSCEHRIAWEFEEKYK